MSIDAAFHRFQKRVAMNQPGRWMVNQLLGDEHIKLIVGRAAK
jgi:hypothetical protein